MFYDYKKIRKEGGNYNSTHVFYNSEIAPNNTSIPCIITFTTYFLEIKLIYT